MTPNFNSMPESTIESDSDESMSQVEHDASTKMHQDSYSEISAPTESAGTEAVDNNNDMSTVQNAGITYELDSNGKPLAYHSNGFTFEYHESDNNWYYHQDSGGEYVKINEPTVDEDGTIFTHEQGFFNNGREHRLTPSGQSSESVVGTKIGQANDHLALAVMPHQALPAISIDSAIGTNTYDTLNAVFKGFGNSLIDSTVNSTLYFAGLAQGGLEEIGVLPDWKQIDVAIPDLDLYEDYSSEDYSTQEKIAYRTGQVGGFATKAAFSALSLIRHGKSALSFVRNLRD